MDGWFCSGPIHVRNPNLFCIFSDPFSSTNEGRGLGAWAIQFRRPFGLAKVVEWDNLSREIKCFQEREQDDVVTWSLESLGSFSTRPMYLRDCQRMTVLSISRMSGKSKFAQKYSYTR